MQVFLKKDKKKYFKNNSFFLAYMKTNNDICIVNMDVP